MNDWQQAIELRLLVITVAKTARTAIDHRLAQLDADISSLQYAILRTLSHADAETITELSRRFRLDPSTLVPSADALERKALIVRERDPNDRRRFPLRLTPAGAELIKRIDAVTDDDPLLIGLQAMGETDAGQLLHLMRTLIQQLPDGDSLLESVNQRMTAYQTES